MLGVSSIVLICEERPLPDHNECLGFVHDGDDALVVLEELRRQNPDKTYFSRTITEMSTETKFDRHSNWFAYKGIADEVCARIIEALSEEDLVVLEKAIDRARMENALWELTSIFDGPKGKIHERMAAKIDGLKKDLAEETP